MDGEILDPIATTEIVNWKEQRISLMHSITIRFELTEKIVASTASLKLIGLSPMPFHHHEDRFSKRG